jgi:hypothetical protein
MVNRDYPKIVFRPPLAKRNVVESRAFNEMAYRGRTPDLVNRAETVMTVLLNRLRDFTYVAGSDTQ